MCFRLRQYPLYSKTEPPAALASHFTPEVFKKSQSYGKDKAQFALISGLFKQCIDSTMLHFGFYAWSWVTSGRLLSWFGYGPEYEVCFICVLKWYQNSYLFSCVGRSFNQSASSLSCSSCRLSHRSHYRFTAPLYWKRSTGSIRPLPAFSSSILLKDGHSPLSSDPRSWPRSSTFSSGLVTDSFLG